MDADRFDALTRSLRSRRGTLGTLLGGLLGLVGAAPTEALGRCIATGRRCRQGSHARPCCSGNCMRNRTCGCASTDDCAQPKHPCRRAVCSRRTGRCRIIPRRPGTICNPARCLGPSYAVPAKTCTRRGTCTRGPIVSCGSYTCNPATGSCFSTCTGAAECAATEQCIGGFCVPAPPRLIGLDVPNTVNVTLSVQGTVTLDRPAQGNTTITIDTVNDNVTVADSTIPDGQTTGTFPITGVTPGPETITATLGATTLTDTIEVTNSPV